ncbi:MAG: C25 family cysteine peptidase [Chitinophagaceae bacterium]|nr:C25 family cysteine peptidase [Chitinophagaceae bacterium]
MKRFLLFILLSASLLVQGQTYNNEWIDYNKTYYKFSVGTTGLHRISQATLNSLGIAGTPAEQFQLWRNGKQVPIYTSTATGPLASGGYIEFWGLRNDGYPDRELYRNQDYKLIDKHSMITDTVAFFLTINPNTAQNLRLVTTANNVAGNVLPAEPYFMYTEGKYCHDYINPGFYIDAGEYVHSSTYDRGENFICYDIGANATFTQYHNVFLYSGGPAATFKLNVAGNAINIRNIRVKINGDSILGQNVDFLNYARLQGTVPLSLLGSGTAQVEIKNTTPGTYDRMVISQYELIYPRVFNFDGQKNFEFSLPANPAGNYLQITSFNYGSTAPILYDLTNGKRYVANIATPGQVRVVLEPSAVERQLVLVSQDASNLRNVTSMVTRNFIDYTNTLLQGDYIIISDPILNSTAGGAHPLDEYAAYRSSANGGGFNVKIYPVNELVDQFGLGIKKNPAALRNFLSWAKNNFATRPRFVFLIGHGMTYDYYYYYQNTPEGEKLNLVPTYGAPASDWLLVTDSAQYLPHTPIGRLSAINGEEVGIYLNKITQYEDAQRYTSPLISEKAWIKNFVHVVGASDSNTQRQLEGYMENYKIIISDTLVGANVASFSKSSADAVQPLTDETLQNLFSTGISQLAYFGHSSATVLDFNLDNPDRYNNQGKYPVFIVMGCNAGNFFSYNPARFFIKETLSEKFVLADQRGSIAFLASSHFGIAHYLHRYNSQTYSAQSSPAFYDKSMGEILLQSINQLYATTSFNDFFSRMHAEENTFHGDPALKLNTQPKPDYVVEDPMVVIDPGFLSIADTSFNVNARFMNMGMAIDDSIVVEVKRTYPNGSTEVVHRDTLAGIRYMDSIAISLHILPARDKGLNKITVTIDADMRVDEMYETNNSVTKSFFIYEDDIKPVYPLDLAIVNKQNIKLIASTANPFSVSQPYKVEIDTTAFFNSPFKLAQTVTTSGGLLEYSPGLTFTDSTVYYWRVSSLDTAGNPAKWNTASFIYLANSELGFNQSHFFQHTQSTEDRLYIDSADRRWKYHPVTHNLFVRNAIYPTGGTQNADFTISVDGEVHHNGGCNFNELIINVYDSLMFRAMQNNYSGGVGLYGSVAATCGPLRTQNFQYLLGDTTWRRKAMQFLENVVPDGAYVVIRSNTAPWFTGNTYAAAWAADTSIYGSGKSLYHTLKNQGLYNIDLYDTMRCFAMIYKKNRQASFTPKVQFGQNEYDRLTLTADCETPDYMGFATSPILGPAKEWKQLKWRGTSNDVPFEDIATVDIIGVTSEGVEAPLLTGIGYDDQDYDISGIDANAYPFLRVRIKNIDSTHLTPYQLRYWRLLYDPVPEGAVAPNILFAPTKDTFEVGEPVDFRLAFKNVSDADFDSLRIKLVVTNQNNVENIIPVGRFKPLLHGDTVTVRHFIPTSTFVGRNSLFVDVNPDNDQPEQFHFNNFLYKEFYVKADQTNPLLDVTFDGVHILNRDIVSSKPHITVKLKDESKWMILDDTSGVKVQVRYPNGTLRPYHFSNADTLTFTEAGLAPNNDNTATIDFYPFFTEDGDYELIVTGEDKSGNNAGAIEYRVAFQVINKPMISNLLNYPNPFTTSTAFVFTITGSEVPQNMKIEIMTITGKIVREITIDELGPLHIGRNITEFKWDGTDQFGQKLANGIYLYRVVTNLNGKSLEKYKAEDDNTDKYFNKGYGKMYLMR